MRVLARYDPTSQSVRDPGDTTTGVLFADDGPVTVGRHVWRGGRHVRRCRGWWVVVVMIVVPVVAVAVAVRSLPVGPPAGPGSSTGAMGGRSIPDTGPTAGHAETAVRAPEHDATPSRVGSDPSVPAVPGEATVAAPSVAARVGPELCPQRRCVPWVGGSPDPSASPSAAPSSPDPSTNGAPLPSLSPAPSGGTP